MPDFFRFLLQSPTPWHAAKEIGNQLAAAHFSPLSERDSWQLVPGHGYFVQREGTLIAAFRIPKQKPSSALLLASHIDSPGLKIKPHPDLAHKEIAQIGTEVYGGPLLHSWFDRDLAIAGKIETDAGSQLIFLEDCPLIIPQLAIHLDRTINEKGVLVHKQDHLKAVLSIQGDVTLATLLKKHYPFKTLYAFDLFLVPLEKPGLVGMNRDLAAGYRIDNLSCAYACLEALIRSSARTETLQLAVFWDHEEIGSGSSTGAGSLFIDQILERIGLSLHQNREDFHRLKSASLILSADVAHGWNPNFADKYDPQNSPLLGQGTVLKFNAGRKYATDAASAAMLCKIAEKHKLKIQRAANRSDIPSGSTVGPIMSTNTGIPTIDLGLACWAMHSTREIVSYTDLKEHAELMRAALDEWTPKQESR